MHSVEQLARRFLAQFFRFTRVCFFLLEHCLIFISWWLRLHFLSILIRRIPIDSLLLATKLQLLSLYLSFLLGKLMAWIKRPDDELSFAEEELNILFASLFLSLAFFQLFYRHGLFSSFLEIAGVAARAGISIFEKMVFLALLFSWLFAVLTLATEDWMFLIIICFPFYLLFFFSFSFSFWFVDLILELSQFANARIA